VAPIRQAPLLQLWTGSEVLVPTAKAARTALARLLRDPDVTWLDAPGDGWAHIDRIQLTGKGTADLVRALACAVSMPSNVDAIRQKTLALAKRYGRLSMLRCYMGGGQDQHLTDKGTDNDSTNNDSTNAVGTTDANTDTTANADPTTMQSTASATVTKWLEQMATDFAIFVPSASSDAPVVDMDAAVIAAVNNVMEMLSADSEEFAVDQYWRPSSGCRITLCTGACDAGSEHNAFAVAGDSTLRPGCGHDLDHGLCSSCQPHQDDDTINVCKNCKTSYRNPGQQALTLASVTSTLTETTTGCPVGHIKMCYLKESGDITEKEKGIYFLRKAAVQGSARLDPGEIDMLAAAHSPGWAATPRVGDKYRVVTTAVPVRKQLCGPCLHKMTIAPDESPACAHVESSADDVVYVHNHDDIVGLLAAQATAKDGTERQQLRDKCKTALDHSLLKKADKAFLSRLNAQIFDTHTTK
jgi:hypothetical protein